MEVRQGGCGGSVPVSDCNTVSAIGQMFIKLHIVDFHEKMLDISSIQSYQSILKHTLHKTTDGLELE